MYNVHGDSKSTEFTKTATGTLFFNNVTCIFSLRITTLTDAYTGFVAKQS